MTNFNNDIEVTIQYDPNELGGINEQDLKISYYDEALGQWVDLPSTVDTMNHTVTAITNHFTKFAIFGPISSTVSLTVEKDGTGSGTVTESQARDGDCARDYRKISHVNLINLTSLFTPIVPFRGNCSEKAQFLYSPHHQPFSRNF